MRISDWSSDVCSSDLHVVPLAEADTVRIVEPSYPTTEGLPMRTLRRAVEGALERLTTLPEWASPSLVAQRGWPSWDAAVRQAHAPGAAGDLDPASPARARLAYRSEERRVRKE